MTQAISGKLIGKKSIGAVVSFTMAKWLIFAILILTYILVYFHRMVPGVVSEYLMADFNTTGAKLGTLSAIYFFIYAIMQIPSGVLADTLGTRTAIVAGNLTAGIGSICFGLATSFGAACFGRFLVGLGVSVVFVAIIKNNSVWFEERVFGFMSGLTLLFGNLGSITAAGPLSLLLNHFTWRAIFIGIGGVSLLLALLGLLIVRNRPEDLGFPCPALPAGGKPAGLQGSWLSHLWGILNVLKLWPGFWVQLGMLGSLYAFMGLWAVPYLRDVHHLSRGSAADHVSVMLIAFALGALFFGWFSDRIGKRKPVLLASALGYLSGWLVLIHAPWSPGMEGYLLFGFIGFSGSGCVLTFACAKEIIHPERSGMAVSVVNTGCFIGTALMQPLFGWIVDRSWDGMMTEGVRIYSAGNFHNGFLAMLVFGMIGFAGALRIQETGCKNITRPNHS